MLGELATAAASALGHNYVGTEHILLALSSHPALLATGATQEAVRATVLELLSAPARPD